MAVRVGWGRNDADGKQAEPLGYFQELVGHKDVKTTVIYTHVLNRGGRAVRSPADNLSR
jgi:integrase